MGGNKLVTTIVRETMRVDHDAVTRIARIFRRQTQQAENSRSDQQTCREEEGLAYQTSSHQTRLVISVLWL